MYLCAITNKLSDIMPRQERLHSATGIKRIDTGGNFTGTWYQIPSTLNPDTSNSSPAALQSGGMYILNKSQSTVLQSSDFIDASITTNCNGMTLLFWSNPRTVLLTAKL